MKHGGEIGVLYDGWELAYAPDSPAAVFLFELLHSLPEEVRAVLAIPTELMRGIYLPTRVNLRLQPAADNAAGRLKWEQQTLSRIARQHGCQIIHLQATTPAIFGGIRTVSTPSALTTIDQDPKRGFIPRIRESLSVGAAGQLAATFWPDGLPFPETIKQVKPLPMLVSPEFNPHDPPNERQLAEVGVETGAGYVLYHGSQEVGAMERLLAMWSWAAGSIGEYHPLVAVGFGKEKSQQLWGMAAEHQLEGTIRILENVPPDMMPVVYRGSKIVIHLGETLPWGSPVQLALACGKPMVADSTLLSEAMVGPAGYLFASADARAMGAAVLAIAVNEEVAEGLREAAMGQAAKWPIGDFGKELSAAYHEAAQ